ncbi:MAG: PilZ domain-containing protein [Magnetococcus sp. YQC-5]
MRFVQKFSNKEEWSRRQERRRAPRFEIHPLVKLTLANGAVVNGHLADMSVCGALMETKERPFGLTPGEEGVLSLLVSPGSPEAEHRFLCLVVRVSQSGVALRLLPDVTAEQQAAGA